MKKKIIYGCESRGDHDSKYLVRYTLIDTKSLAWDDFISAKQHTGTGWSW